MRAKKWTKQGRMKWAVTGMLLSAGSFFANTGFGLGGAVLVQVVKLL